MVSRGVAWIQGVAWKLDTTYDVDSVLQLIKLYALYLEFTYVISDRIETYTATN